MTDTPQAGQNTTTSYVRGGMDAVRDAMLGSSSYQDFITLWRDIQQERGTVPSKDDFSMQRLKPFLPRYFLAEWTGEDVINRLVGSTIDTLIGAPLTGLGFMQGYKGEQHAYFMEFWRQLVEHPCGVLTVRTMVEADGSALRLEGVDLPLTNRQGERRFICGVGHAKQVFDLPPEDRPAAGRRVWIDYLEYIDLGFGLPENRPCPAAFNAAA